MDVDLVRRRSWLPHSLRRALRWWARSRRPDAAPPHHAVGQWSDADLVRAWERSEVELRACRERTAGRTLTVVMWRATLLDELDRRGLTLRLR